MPCGLALHWRFEGHVPPLGTGLAELLNAVGQLQAVEDPLLLGLDLGRGQLARELLAEEHQILHEEAHRLPGAAWELRHGARVKTEVDVLDPREVWSTLLHPGDGPVQGRTITQHEKG